MSAIHIRATSRPLRETVIADVGQSCARSSWPQSIALLVACVNVSGLLWSAPSVNAANIAVRVAIGASSNRIIRESVVEGMLLSVLAGCSVWRSPRSRSDVALHFLPASLPRINSVSIDPLVAGFALLVAIATGVLVQSRPCVRCLAHQSDRQLSKRALKPAVRATRGCAPPWS